MTTTVIDQLIVKLGLDPKDFEKGTKQAAAAELKLSETVKRTNNEMGASFVSFTKKFLSAAAAIAMLRKLVGALADVSTETRRLGIDSANWRMSAAEIRDFTNAVEMMGGKTEDALASMEGLQKAVYDLNYMGAMSPQLEMLARIGVQFQDATGHARNFKDVVEDTADALERAQKNGIMDRTAAYFTARQAGFDEGTTNLILGGRAKVEAELAAQRNRHQVNADDLAAAEKIERGRTEIAQRTQSAEVQANSVAVQGATNTVEAYQRAVAATTDAIEDLGNTARSASGWWQRYTARSMTPEQRERTYRGEVQAAAKKYGVPFNLLHGQIRQESNFDPNARSKAGAVGIAQFMPATARERGFTAGLDPKRDIDEMARYMRDLHTIAVRRAAKGEDPWKLALQYYNAGTGRVAQSRKPGGKPLAAETINYPDAVMRFAQQAPISPLTHAQGATATPAAAARAGNVTVNVGPVTVQTQATDANGIAQDFSGAVQRKINAAQADTGMQ